MILITLEMILKLNLGKTKAILHKKHFTYKLNINYLKEYQPYLIILYSVGRALNRKRKNVP